MSLSGSTLYERDEELSRLGAARDRAVAGAGTFVWVCGEPGAGKTRLVQEFLRTSPELACAWGYCEPSGSPRPLGPLFDIGNALPGALRAALTGSPHAWDLFDALVTDLRAAIATDHQALAVVIEDANWADQATLEWLRYAARRAANHRLMLIATARDTEPGAQDARDLVTASLPSDAWSEIALRPLSASRVIALATERGLDGRQLYSDTRGNPLLVTALLQWEGEGLPRSLRQLVGARLQLLSAPAREVLAGISVHPDRIALDSLDTIVPGAREALDECCARGLLVREREHLRFQHETMRQAIYESLEPATRPRLHLRALDAVAFANPALLTHHALRAGEYAAAGMHALAAADQARSAGAHRQAADFLHIVLEHGQPDARMQASLLDRLAEARYRIMDFDGAGDASARAWSLWCGLADPVGQARCLGVTFRMTRYDPVPIERLELSVIGPVLAALDDSAAYERATLLLAASWSCAMAGDVDGSVSYSEQAAAARALLVSRQERAELLWIQAWAGFVFGLRDPQPLLAEALDAWLSEHAPHVAASAYCCLAFYRAAVKDGEGLKRLCDDGIRHCDQHDLPAESAILRAMRLRAMLFEGEHEALVERAQALAADTGRVFMARYHASICHGLALARLGRPGSERLILDGMSLLEARRAPLGLIDGLLHLAEACWLSGLTDAARSHIARAQGLLRSHRNPWLIAQVGDWARRLGLRGDGDAGELPAPYALAAAGKWREAASAWRERGLRYEAALALAEAGPDGRREAVAILAHTGAVATVRRMNADWREAGASILPRGPNASTRRNPHGLTRRELQILPLLAQGKGNSDIARELSRSVKTVEKHVSSVLAKLAVSSRVAAGIWARGQGLVPGEPGAP